MQRSDPQVATWMAQAVDAHRRGDRAVAAAAYARVLQRAPEHTEALQLLGALRWRMGDPAAGLILLDRAVALDPSHGVAWLNRGLVLAALGRAADAMDSLRRALALQPAALAALRPLAGLLLRAGQIDEALPVLRAWVAQAPDDGAARLALGQAQSDTGDLAGAEASWRAALALPSPPPGVHALLGGLLLRQGRAEAAWPHLSAAAAAEPERVTLRVALVDALFQIAAPPPAVETLVADLLRDDDLDGQRLERVAREILARDPAIAAALADPSPEHLGAATDALARSPVTCPWLTRAVVADPGWERLLVAARGVLVRRAIEGAPLPSDLLEGLAQQAWNTEYAWAEPDPAQVARLRAALVGPLGSWTAADWDRLRALAALTPLALPALGAEGWEARPAAALVRQQVIELALERDLAAQIPELVPTADATSAAVRAMYEENPYPRLVSAHRRTPLPLHRLVATWLPHVTDAPRGPVRVLIAGCGTGQHVLNAATRLSDAEILAVDLSRASLARAQRRASAWGLTVRFAVADLLQLGALSERFELIESVGVLHHLADPAAGLRVLTGLLAPGGLMQLGLYSERGRQDVVAARALIAAWGLPPTSEGIREARARLLALPADHPARGVVHSPDFASLSGTRDLIFHVCEHRTTPAQLEALLRACGLEFLGFQHASPEVAARYRARFPEDPTGQDLQRWEVFETEHPRVFRGMFNFWCRRA